MPESSPSPLQQPSPAPQIGFPVIENAALAMESSRVMLQADYNLLSTTQKRSAFTVAGIEILDDLVTIRRLLVESIKDGSDLRTFRRRLTEAFGGKSILDPAGLEKVFRFHLSRSYIAGQLKMMTAPLAPNLLPNGPRVGDCFPYMSFLATHDDRTPPSHKALEQHGLGGTNVYRRDDPFWERFLTPLCRCAVNVLSIAGAAAAGVREAQEWLKTGEPPEHPEWVKLPPFDPCADLEDEGADGWGKP